jgi:hypothetical protein
MRDASMPLHSLHGRCSENARLPISRTSANTTVAILNALAERFQTRQAIELVIGII